MMNYATLPFDEVRTSFAYDRAELEKQEKWQDAIELCWEFLQRARLEYPAINPHAGVAHYYMGESYVKLAKFEAAFSCYYTALLLLYESWKINNSWEDDLRRARQNLENFLLVHAPGEDAREVIERARTGVEKGDELFDQATELDSSDPEQCPRILQLLNECLYYSPCHTLAIVNRGIANSRLAEAHAKAGRTDEANAFAVAALSDYETGLRYDPRDKIALFNRAQTYFHARHPKEALADLNAAVKLDAENLNFRYLRALAHEAVGAKQAAIEDWQAVLNSTDTGHQAIANKRLAELGKP